MKIITAILSMLAIATVIYGADQAALQQFQKNYQDCARYLNITSTEVRLDVAFCAVILEGDVIYANGEYSVDGILRKYDAWISDPIKLQQAREVFFRCDNEATRNRIFGFAKTMYLIICGKNILSFLA